MAGTTTADEREQLERFLDDARAGAAATLSGLSDEQSRQRRVPSLTTSLGLITHLTFVETIWFQVVLAGRTRAELGLPGTVDPSFVPDAGATPATVLAAYEDVCAQSRQIAAGYALDHVTEHPRFGPISLRWIYLHMLRETFQHTGHADILREQALDRRA